MGRQKSLKRFTRLAGHVIHVWCTFHFSPRQLFLFLIFQLALISIFRWRFSHHFSAFLNLHTWQPPMPGAIRNGGRCYSYLFNFLRCWFRIFLLKKLAAANKFWKKKLATANKFWIQTILKFWHKCFIVTLGGTFQFDDKFGSVIWAFPLIFVSNSRASKRMKELRNSL